MAPKKKGNKKQQQDDWEAELGETVDPIAQAEEEAKAAEAAKDATAEDDDQPSGAGGLMAALRKRKEKKGKKNKPTEDFVEGEDAPAADDANGTATPPVDLADKAPEEGNMDDEDVFGQPMKKGKGGKQQDKKPADDEADQDDEKDASGRVKTKKEKEKEKKEREKQRKKEQVCIDYLQQNPTRRNGTNQLYHYRLHSRRRPLQVRHPRKKPSLLHRPLPRQ